MSAPAATAPAATATATAKKAPPKPAGPWPAVFPPTVKAKAPGKVPLSEDQVLHLLRRVTYGPTPQLVAEVHQMGAGRWLSQQLTPAKVADKQAQKALRAFPLLNQSSQHLRRYLASINREYGYDAMEQVQQATLMRAVFSRRQLAEVMVAFWSNHFNVTCPSDKVWSTRHVYDATIRKHAFGSFEDLLVAVIQSPAMLQFLDNDASIGREPNENLGRELLELHTVGIDGGYTEKDVFNSALTLTGWSVQDDGSDLFVLKPGYRYAGHVKVMKWQSANTDTSAGVAVGTSYLTYLAHHPHTARHLCRKLVTRFVTDNPPVELVAKLTKVYLDNKTQIVPVLEALFSSHEFWASTGQKVRTPYERAVASMRGLGYHPLAGLAPDNWDDLVNHLSDLGQAPLQWGPPNGYPDTAHYWLSTQTTVGQWNSAIALAGGWWANGKGVAMKSMKSPQTLLGSHFPAQPAAGQLIDGIAQLVLGQKLPETHRSAILYWYQERADHIPPDWKLEEDSLRTLAGLVLSGPIGGLR
jgi:uncharacterized protein (DUF1800 family)